MFVSEYSGEEGNIENVRRSESGKETKEIVKRKSKRRAKRSRRRCRERGRGCSAVCLGWEMSKRVGTWWAKGGWADGMGHGRVPSFGREKL